MELRGKVVLVTGAGRRLGRAIAAALAAEGARLAAHFNSSEAGASEVVKAATAAGGDADAFQADLRDPSSHAALVKSVRERFGGVDVLVNSAAVMERTRIEDVTAEEWDRIMAINLRAPFFLARECVPVMRDRPAPGVIINIADLAAFETWPDYVVHGISKSAVVSMSRSLARVLAPRIRVNCIAPGAVLLPEAWPESEARKLATSTPLRRIGSPDDVVRAVLYLIQADFVTGETLVVDGGRNVRR